MGKLEDFSINLDPAQLVYYPGERLSGFVVIDLNDAMEMKCLKVEFTGIGYCQWKENNLTRYNGNEKIIKKETCLFGILKNSPQTFSHASGKHSYPFSFTLPTDLPSSFEHVHGDNGVAGDTYGYVRYMLKAQIEKPWKFNYKVKHPIIINEYIDTNLRQHSHGPGSELSEKVSSPWCSCFGKKNQLDLEFAASIDRACYCPGEPILINARVLNRSSSKLDSLTAEIRQEIRYKASGRTKMFETILDDLKGPHILKGASLSWQNMPFIIPPSAPTISNSKVLSVKYDVQFQVGFSSGKEKSINLPLLIGSVPHKGQYGKFVQHYKIMPPADCINDIRFPVPMPSIFSIVEDLNLSYRSTGDAVLTAETSFCAREVVYGYCKPAKCADVNIKEVDDDYTWGSLTYTPLYTYVKIAREIPTEKDDSDVACDPNHLVNVTI